jgi:hypothetical protein
LRWFPVARELRRNQDFLSVSGVAGMIEFISKSNDDPPIFALRIAGNDPAEEVGTWLEEKGDVQRVELHLAGGAGIGQGEVDELSDRHQVSIHVVTEATNEG